MIAMFAPLFAKYTAIERPKPWPAPVIAITLSVKFMVYPLVY